MIESPLQAIALLSALALLPFLVVMATSYVKLVIVLSLVRNALGVQQIPPNIALHAIAIILTIYIMMPIANEVYTIISQYDITFDNPESIKTAFGEGVKPFQAFLSKHAHEASVNFFFETAAVLWPQDYHDMATHDSLFILLPAFTVSELVSAFEIGFLLYLPFIAIDLIISNILLAMGMMMLSPMTISLPFKLLLFVLLDGWSRLIFGLVLSYQ